MLKKSFLFIVIAAAFLCGCAQPEDSKATPTVIAEPANEAIEQIEASASEINVESKKISEDIDSLLNNL